MWRRLTVERPHFVRPLADFCSLVNLAATLRTTVREPLQFASIITVVAPGTVCVLRQLGQIRKKRWRLADEKPHVRQELQCTHGGAFRLRRSNDRNNRKIRIQERTRFGHDQVLVEELVAATVQIRKCHRHASHRIDGSQRRRITRLVRPGLKMHGLGGADADQDSQDFPSGRPVCQRGVKAVATLFNGWKVESRRIRDRL